MSIISKQYVSYDVEFPLIFLLISILSNVNLKLTKLSLDLCLDIVFWNEGNYYWLWPWYIPDMVDKSGPLAANSTIALVFPEHQTDHCLDDWAPWQPIIHDENLREICKIIAVDHMVSLRKHWFIAVQY